MSSPENNEKKELYEFDDTCLEDLNQVREQINLLAIGDEEHVETEVPQIPDTPPFTFNEEDYECNTDYMTSLNKIRKEENLEEVIDKTAKELETKQIETNTIFVNNNTSGQNKKLSNIPIRYFTMEDDYTPPRKKKNIKESTTKDSDKHVKFNYLHPLAKVADSDKSLSYPMMKSPEVKKSNLKFSIGHTFCSLNTPISISPKQKKIQSKITILVNEESEDPPENAADVSWLTLSLDNPRILKKKFSFSPIAYINKWGNNQEFQFEEIFSSDLNRSERNKVQKEVNLSKFETASKDFNLEKNLFEVETISSLSNMYQLKTETDSTENDIKSASDDEVKCKCGCFSICFNKKLQNFFS